MPESDATNFWRQFRNCKYDLLKKKTETKKELYCTTDNKELIN